jgi:CcmD family protein
VKSIRCAGLEINKNLMDARNFTYMFYGFLAAWLIVLLYVISLARRGARLKKELEDVKQLHLAATATEPRR